MTLDDIVYKMNKYPKYLKIGSGELAKRFKTTVEVIIESKKIVKSTKDTSNLEIRQVWEGPKGKTIHYTTKLDGDAFISNLISEIKKIAPTDSEIKASSGNCVLILSIPDVHYGKYGESIQVLANSFAKAIKYLISIAEPFGIDKIVFPIGSDFFNTDNLNYTTTKGTPQMDSVTWRDSFITGSALIIDTIKSISSKYKIEVPIIPGNHDWERSFYLGVVLDTYFKNCNSVYIDNNINPRKYTIFGKNLFGFTHGKYEKLSELPLIMAREVPEYWGNTLFRNIFTGHFHTHQKYEFQGVNVNFMPSLSINGEWEDKYGYFNNRRAQGYIYHKTKGFLGYFQTVDL